MRRLLLAVLVVAAAACRRPRVPTAAPDEAPAGVAMIDYAEKAGAYACRAPADWRVYEDPADAEDVMFFGPGRASIAIGKYDGSSGTVRTPQDYYAAQKAGAQEIGPLETAALNGRAVYRLHELKPVRAPNARQASFVAREDVVLIPAGRGFLAVEHRAPRESYAATLPVFEAVAASLKPRG